MVSVFNKLNSINKGELSLSHRTFNTNDSEGTKRNININKILLASTII